METDLRNEPVKATVLIVASASAVFGVAALLWAAIDAVLLLFVGALLSVLLAGIAHWVSRALRLGYGWALSLILVCGLAGAVLILLYVAPGIADQVDALRKALPESLDTLRSYVARHEWARDVLDQMPSRSTVLGSRADVFERVTGVFSTTLGALTSLVVVLFFGLFLAADPGLYRRGLLQLLPPRHRTRAGEVVDAVNETLGWWLLAKIASMLVVGAMTWVGLWMLGVPLPFTLALIASTLTFIPNIGPVLSAVPALLLALLQSPTAAAWVTVLFISSASRP
ncbi:MAG TPA: AI-2E family transporter [Terriglobales bacterium]